MKKEDRKKRLHNNKVKKSKNWTRLFCSSKIYVVKENFIKFLEPRQGWVCGPQPN